MWNTLKSLWKALAWLRQQKKDLEANAQKKLSPVEAMNMRVKIASICFDLEDGRNDRLPKVLQWLFAHTECDNLAGQFGRVLLQLDNEQMAKLHGLFSQIRDMAGLITGDAATKILRAAQDGMELTDAGRKP